MRSPYKTNLIATMLVVGLGALAHAASATSDIRTTANMTCIGSNGIPDHETGQFPNSGNPHTMRAQNIQVCVPSDPVKGNTPQEVQTVGIATNGILIRPGTADYYDASSRRGFSRDSSSGWNLEGMGARSLLGLDAQNAHVDERGLYHYHGMPSALEPVGGETLIGWAADGFEIH